MPSKFIFVLLVCCFFALEVKAIDTLTIRQVYNFSVGDTFDYKEDNATENGPPTITTYYRKVLIQQTYSAHLDSIYMQFAVLPVGTLEFDTITNLDSVAIYYLAQANIAGPGSYGSDTTYYPGYPSDTAITAPAQSSEQWRFTKNLGETFYLSDDDDGDYFSNQLIYYSNGTTTLGTPYYVADGSEQVHYIPLPEECAVWTETYYGTLNPSLSPIYETITEQIKTGNKIYQGGINYVELLVSIQYNSSNYFTSDSLIGYFYNDSAQHLVYFIPPQDLGIPNVGVIYDFNFTYQDVCRGGGIDSILIGGSYRTMFNCQLTYQPAGDCPGEIIEGIGSTSGLLMVGQIVFGTYLACGQLTCFSVCGQTLYPNDSSVSCPLLTGIQNVPASTQIQLFPNPAHDNCTLQISNAGENLTAAILDITGREILPLFNNQKIATFNFSTGNLSQGIYLLRVTDSAGRQNILKLIKQ